jgi:hypothetical protein
LSRAADQAFVVDSSAGRTGGQSKEENTRNMLAEMTEESEPETP